MPLGLALGWTLLVILLLVSASDTDLVRSLERQSLDQAFRTVGPIDPTPDDIELVLIDSSSLLAMRSFYAEEEGQLPDEPWPWQRLFWGALIHFLGEAGAEAVILDLDLSGPAAVDRFFDGGDSRSAAKAMAAGKVGYLALSLKEQPGIDQLPEDSLLRRTVERAAGVFRRESVSVSDAGGVLSAEPVRYQFNTGRVPYAELADENTAKGFGFVNATRDPDDRVRRVPLVAQVGETWLPSITLAVAMDRWGVEALEVAPGPKIVAGDRRIPLDSDGRYLLNWYGPIEDSFPLVSAHSLIKTALASYERSLSEDQEPLYWPHLGWKNQISAEDVAEAKERYRGKLVLIGAYAAELGDMYANPYNEAYPGVAVLATALGNLTSDQALVQAPWLVRAGLLALVLLLNGWLVPFVLRKGLGSVIVILLLYTLLFGYLFRSDRLWIDWALPVGGSVVAYGSSLFFLFLRVGRLRRRLRKTFEHVVSPQLVGHLIANPSSLILGGEVRRLTVLFSDLQNSTALSEQMTPEDWVARLNQYFSECTNLVVRRRAYLDKYIGDGIMAVWGAPVEVENHEAEACLAVLQLRSQLDALEEEIEAAYGVRLATRIGINSGEMVVGMVGSDDLSHYTVLGDAVVIASRLEGANKFFGTRTLIGEDTFEAAKEVIDAREIDRIVLKGKSEAITIYEPLAEKGSLSADDKALCEAYGEGLSRYRAREFAAAVESFERALSVRAEDGPSALMIERCQAFKKDPPGADWRGEFQMTSK